MKDENMPEFEINVKEKSSVCNLVLCERMLSPLKLYAAGITRTV